MVILTGLSEVFINGIYGMEKLIQQEYNLYAARRFFDRQQEMSPMLCMLMRGRLTEDLYWRLFLGYQRWPFGLEEIKALLSRSLAESITGTLELYSHINGYPNRIGLAQNNRHPANHTDGCPKIWIVSDHIAERKTELETLHPNVFNLASETFWSYDLGVLKRDYGFFEYLLHINIIAPDEVVFIDSSKVNVHSAADSKIKSILYDGNTDSLRSKLISLGFTFAPK